jgi:hypothetical protein
MQNVQDSRVTTESHRARRAVVQEDTRQLPDFVDFLSERLSMNRAAALDVLTQLVAEYRPARAYEISVLELEAG